MRVKLDGRVYELNSIRKVYFNTLKTHNGNEIVCLVDEETKEGKIARLKECEALEERLCDL